MSKEKTKTDTILEKWEKELTITKKGLEETESHAMAEYLSARLRLIDDFVKDLKTIK